MIASPHRDAEAYCPTSRSGKIAMTDELSQSRLEQELNDLRKEMSRLKAIQEIQNLMGAYTVNHTPLTMRDHVDLFAMDQPDVSCEAGDRGAYVGPDAVRQ